MNQRVPNLYDNLNLNTIPKIIKDYFFEMSTKWRNEIEVKPFNMKFVFEDENLSFYGHQDVSDFIETMIKSETILNDDFNLITHNEFFRQYTKEYGKGFFKGYINYADELKKGSEIFEPNNKQTAHKIFSRVVSNGFFSVKIAFPISLIPMNQSEIIKTKFNREIDYYLNKDAFYSSGFDTGEFYKAWSIILHNPTLFEDIFIKHFEDAKIKKPLLQNKENNAPKWFAYFEIGTLIAQGKLSKLEEGVFMYNNKTFQKAELLKELDIDLKITSFRQYIEGTFKGYPNNTDKLNLLGYKSKMKKIIEYCKFHKIDISKEYQTIFDSLE